MLETFPIEVLELNPRNPRIDPVENEEQALSELLANQGNKLVKLARDIALYGLNPANLPIVSDSELAGKKLIREGNRRIAAIKMALNPDIIPDKFPSLRRAAEKLHVEEGASIPTEVRCHYTNDEQEVNRLLLLIHSGEQDGVGTISWGSMERSRFIESVKGPSEAQPGQRLIDYLRREGVIAREVNEADRAVTSLTRFLSTPEIREMLGIAGAGRSLDFSAINTGRVMALISAICEPSFSIHDYSRVEKRKEFVRGLISNLGADSCVPDDELPLTPTGGSDAEGVSGGHSSADDDGIGFHPPYVTRRPGAPIRRRRLVPSSCTISITNPRVSRIFGELKRLDAESFPNASAVLLRTVIELSCDCYLKALQSTYDIDKKTLSNKVKTVLGKLRYEGLVSESCFQAVSLLRGEDRGSSDSNVATLHAYVHGVGMNPIASELISTWDNVEEFLRVLWEQVSAAGKRE